MSTKKLLTSRTDGPGLEQVEIIDDITVLPASEALTAGEFVQVFDDGGTGKVRKATNDDPDLHAEGFVLADVPVDVDAAVYRSGDNGWLTGLTVGADYYLGADGEVTATKPTGSGELVQHLGKAVSATSMQVRISDPLLLV